MKTIIKLTRLLRKMWLKTNLNWSKKVNNYFQNCIVKINKHYINDIFALRWSVKYFTFYKNLAKTAFNSYLKINQENKWPLNEKLINENIKSSWFSPHKFKLSCLLPFWFLPPVWLSKCCQGEINFLKKYKFMH